MTSEPDAVSPESTSAGQRDLVLLVAALIVAAGAARVVAAVTRTGGVPSPVLQVLAGDLAVWLPLAAGAAWVVARGGGLTRGRFRIDAADVVFAIGIVILTRVLDVTLSIAFTGTTGLVPVPSLGAPDQVLLIVSAAGLVIVSPVLEEVFFRGLFQRRLASELTPRSRWLAVVVTAVLFALSHLFLGSTPEGLGGLQTFLTTFVLGILTGTLVAMTDRIGGAIVAHVLFNAVAVVATWPR